MRMRTKRLLLNLFGAGCAIGGVCILGLFLIQPEEQIASTPLAPMNEVDRQRLFDSQVIALAKSLNLQGPLREPTQKQTEPQEQDQNQVSSVKLPEMTLVSVFYAGEKSLAVFEWNEQTVSCAVNESVGGAKVVEIKPLSTKLLYQGKEFEVALNEVSPNKDGLQ